MTNETEESTVMKKALDSNLLWEILLVHRGHSVCIASYGPSDNPVAVCLECEDCNEVIIDAEIYSLRAIDDDGEIEYDDIERL